MSDITETDMGQDDDVLVMAAEIVAAYASNNQVSQGDLPNLIQTVYGTLNGLSGGNGAAGADAAPEAPPAPAVPIDSSVAKDQIICLDCGKGFKTLKRHLNTEHGLSPVEYKARWGLSKEYPLVAPDYSKRRAATAKKIGLGRKPKK